MQIHQHTAQDKGSSIKEARINMATHRPARSRRSPLVDLWVSGVILAICASHVHANDNIWRSVFDSLRDIQLYFGYNYNFNEKEHITETWPDVTYSEETVRVLDGICNVTVLHNLAEHVSDAEKCRTSHLQEKACCWLYNTQSPNITLCTSELNEYCFLRTAWRQLTKLYGDFDDTPRCSEQ